MGHRLRALHAGRKDFRMKRMRRSEIRAAAEDLRDELRRTAPGWAHGVTVSDDHTFITVHAYQMGVIRLANSHNGVAIGLRECNGLTEPCMDSVQKHNYEG